MKKTYNVILKYIFIASFLVLFFLFLPLYVNAETVIDNNSFSSSNWKIWPKNGFNYTEGTLTLTSSNEVNKKTDNDYSITWITTNSPLFNFHKNKVTVKMKDLDIKGSVVPSSRIFQFYISSDKPDDNAISMFYLRITGDGSLSINMKNGAAMSLKTLYTGRTSLPIKFIQVDLDPTSITLYYEDQNGAKKDKIPLTSALTDDWDQKTTYLRIQSQRKPGIGDVKITFQDLTVNSIPVP